MCAAEKAGAPDTARRLRSRVELLLNAAIARGLQDATRLNPATRKSIADAVKAAIDAAAWHGWRSVFRDWAGGIGDVPRDLNQFFQQA
jgi:hypothetical protein